MRAAVLVALAFSIAGCAKQSAQEEERYRLIGAAGSPRDRCLQARKVADAYLQENNRAQYQQWALRADLNCGG